MNFSITFLFLFFFRLFRWWVDESFPVPEHEVQRRSPDHAEPVLQQMPEKKISNFSFIFKEHLNGNGAVCHFEMKAKINHNNQMLNSN